jgi:hypothetical protein
LESVCAGNRTVGSNPTLSAIVSILTMFLDFIAPDWPANMCAISFGSLSSRHEIQRAHRSVQFDPMRIVKWDIRASTSGSPRVEPHQPQIIVRRGALGNLLRVYCGEAAAVVRASVCCRASEVIDTRGICLPQNRNVRIGGESLAPLRLVRLLIDACHVTSGLRAAREAGSARRSWPV